LGWPGKAQPGGLALGNAEQLSHLVVMKALTRRVGLYPAAIDDELRDGAFAGIANHVFSGAGNFLNVDFSKRNVMPREPTLGFATVAAPRRRINHQVHKSLDSRKPAMAQQGGSRSIGQP